MTTPRTAAVLVGSLRKASYSRKVARALAELAPAELTLEIVEIGDLPFYNEDIEPSPPAEWTRFRDQIRAADAALFVTPEYNRSIPAVLKNAVDVGSRPYGSSVWSGKPAAVISQSPGAIGGFGAHHHLRQSLGAIGVPILPQEAYLSGVGALFDAEGRLVNEQTRSFLQNFVEAFAGWIDRQAPARTPQAA